MMVNLENRIFKFRALATDYVYKKEGITWVYGSYVDGYIVNGVIEPCEEYIVLENWCPVKRETVGQFTGLLDKNGKEIYEGDIIKVTGEFAIDNYGIVKWSQQEDDYTYHCGFMVDWQEEVKRRSHLSFWANHREIEIIGNIYENPELLKEANE